MKKNLWLAALVGVALTSCVNEENSPLESNKEVLTFAAPVMATQSRANVYGEINGVLYDKGENFVIFCKSYKGDFAGWENTTGIADYFGSAGETAFNEGNGSQYWQTQNTHYWPDIEYNLAFAAYSPADLELTFGTGEGVSHTGQGLQIKGFATNINANKQYDLMYSDRVIGLNKTNNGSSAVPLVFNHALSSIVFSSEKEDENVNYEITSLKLHGNFVQKGDFNQNIIETTGFISGEAKWENLSSATSADFVPTIGLDNSNKVSVTTVPTQFTQGASALLLIPQAVPADAAVTIEYTKITHPNDNTLKQEMTNKATIKLSDFAQENGNKISTWEMGKRYVYRIAFGQNKRIYFEPTSKNWVQEPTLIHVIQ